ncbi:MAG: hypothetical protein ACRBHB_03725 [Arenicella sp.]
MSHLRLIKSFRLNEYIYSVLLFGILITLAIPLYKSYVANSFTLDVFHGLLEVKTHVAINSAYTGLPNGAEQKADYAFLDDVDGPVKDIHISSQGHLTGAVNLGDYALKTTFMRDNVEAKTVSLHRNVNQQGAYSFVSWQCQHDPNETPFIITEPMPEATLETKYYYFFCNGKIL